MRRAARCFVPLIVALAACGADPLGGAPPGGDASTPPVDGAPSTDSSVTELDSMVIDDGGTPLRTLRLTIGPVRASANEEETLCVTLPLAVESDVLIRSIHTTLTPGTHHVIVYRTTSAPDPTPTPCGSFRGVLSGAAPIFIAQQRDSRLDFPDGVVLRLRPTETVRLEMHYFNYLGADADIQGSVDFDVADGDGRSYVDSDLLFWGTTSISLPPRETTTVVDYHDAPSPSPEPIRIFGLTSHTHQYGIRTTIEAMESASAPAGEVLHESISWSDPPLTQFAPPRELSSGGLRLTCTYMNTSASFVGFGEGFNNEMCFLWAYYFPSRGFLVSL